MINAEDAGSELERALGIIPGQGGSVAGDGGANPVPEAWAAFPTDMDGLTPQPAGIAQVTVPRSRWRSTGQRRNA